MLKQRVAPSETAMSDVLREVLIMKMLSHPNIVNLFEVIDDPRTDHFYMVLEYVEGKWIFEGSGSPGGGLGEVTARRYLRDIVSGLMYLHSHNDDDELRRSPGTPVFTAPECCLGLTYHGKAADTWAVGVTLYCMILGKYPFLGDTLQDTYDKIVNDPLCLPDDLNPTLKNLLEGILCKDPRQRLSLRDVSEHEWVIGDHGPVPQHDCWCQRMKLQTDASIGNSADTLT
nr:serine/threonine-protein kinase GRIK2-like isoform X2 [Ipomoea batatas]